MAEHKERSQLVGDALREGAVLIAVLYPLETIVAAQFDSSRTVDWSYMILSWIFAGILFWWGVIFEGRDEL